MNVFHQTVFLLTLALLLSCTKPPSSAPPPKPFAVSGSIPGDRPPLTARERLTAYQMRVNDLWPGVPYVPPARELRVQSWLTLTTTGAPSARAGHASGYDVNNNGVMGIWGGFSGAAYLADGGAWDQTTNTWTATPTAGAPTAREGMAYAFCASQLSIWGGTASTTLATTLADGARLDIGNALWSPVIATGAPTTRAFASGTSDANLKMLVFGGITTGNAWPTGAGSLGGLYNCSLDTWTALATTGAPTVRVGHAAIWTGTEFIIWGGYDSTNAYVNTGAKYNPAGAGTWTAMTTTGAPTARANMAYAWTGGTDNRLFVWGGLSRTGGVFTFFNDGALYNPTTNTWTSVPNSLTNTPSIRYEPTAVQGAGHVVVWGGTNLVNNANVMLSTGAIFDPPSTWTAITPTGVPTARGSHTMILGTTTQAIVWGGHNGTTTLNTGAQLTFP